MQSDWEKEFFCSENEYLCVVIEDIVWFLFLLHFVFLQLFIAKKKESETRKQ